MITEDQKKILQGHLILRDGFKITYVDHIMENDGVSFEDAAVQVLKFFAERYHSWLDTSIDPWAAKHGITREQAINILFYDDELGPPYAEESSWVEVSEFLQVLRNKNLLKF